MKNFPFLLSLTYSYKPCSFTHIQKMNKNMARQRPSYLNLLQLVGILIIAVVLISHYLNYYNRLSIIINNNLQLAQSSAGKYKGHGWHNSERTISVSTIGETSFARCDLHTVKSEDGSTVINDWLFLEEVNAVNIIVQTLKGQKFVVFEQQKYAIPSNTLSPVQECHTITKRWWTNEL